MKQLTFLLPLLLLGQIVLGQSAKALKSIKVAPQTYENVKVVPLDSDERGSSFIVFVKKNVRLHQHEYHTEMVYILEGKGVMTLGEKLLKVKKGDFFSIPPKTPHGVKVTGRKPMKVLSIQTPEFKGKDRIFLED